MRQPGVGTEALHDHLQAAIGLAYLLTGDRIRALRIAERAIGHVNDEIRCHRGSRAVAPGAGVGARVDEAILRACMHLPR